jgi:hypothetical protein
LAYARALGVAAVIWVEFQAASVIIVIKTTALIFAGAEAKNF